MTLIHMASFSSTFEPDEIAECVDAIADNDELQPTPGSLWVRQNATPLGYEAQHVGLNPSTLMNFYKLMARLDQQDATMAKIAGVL